MKYSEYFEEHDTENFVWCIPFTDRTESYFIVVHDGLVDSIATPDIVAYRYGSVDFDALLEQVAREVDPNYDLYSGYSDLQIALGVMHGVGCYHCPFKEECEAYNSDMEDCDYVN